MQEFLKQESPLQEFLEQESSPNAVLSPSTFSSSGCTYNGPKLSEQLSQCLCQGSETLHQFLNFSPSLDYRQVPQVVLRLFASFSISTCNGPEWFKRLAQYLYPGLRTHRLFLSLSPSLCRRLVAF